MKSCIREDQSHNYKTALQVALRHLSMQWYKDSKSEFKTQGFNAKLQRQYLCAVSFSQ